MKLDINATALSLYFDKLRQTALALSCTARIAKRFIREAHDLLVASDTEHHRAGRSDVVDEVVCDCELNARWDQCDRAERELDNLLALDVYVPVEKSD